jgi:hypothetical protein
MTGSQLYESDFYAWANEHAALLRGGRLSDADILHIAEEIESMGKSEKRELVSRLTVLLLHLLKWQFQPGRRAASWRGCRPPAPGPTTRSRTRSSGRQPQRTEVETAAAV